MAKPKQPALPQPTPSDGTENNLVPAPTPAISARLPGVMASYAALPNDDSMMPLTTLDLTVPTNRLLLQHALAGESTSLWDLDEGTVISVSDIIAHYSESPDEETGEVRCGPMITLVGPEGVYHTGSQYAFRALQVIAAVQGPPPWNPPIRARAVRVRSRNNRDFQSLLLEG